MTKFTIRSMEDVKGAYFPMGKERVALKRTVDVRATKFVRKILMARRFFLESDEKLLAWKSGYRNSAIIYAEIRKHVMLGK